jgi:hypothetical protein
MSKRKDRKFLRRVRARMAKTGESYAAAHRNLSKSRTLETTDQQTEKPLAQPQERSSGPRFAIHLQLAALGRAQPAGSTPQETPEQQAARRARLWSRLERELDRIASPRQAAQLLDAIKKQNLDDDRLEQLVWAYGSLPRGFMRQLELIAQQIQQLQPVLEQAAAAIPALAQQASEMWNLAASLKLPATVEALRDLLPTLDSTFKAVQDLHAARKIPAELAASAVPEILLTTRGLLDDVGGVPIHRLVEEDVVSAALKHLEAGPVAAAMRYVNEGPVAAAMQYINDDAVTAAMHYFDGDAVAAAMRYFNDGPVAAARMLNGAA